MPADLSVSLTYDNAADAIDWLCRAFGFTERLAVPGPDGTVRHSELSFGAAVVMVSSPRPGMGRVGALHHQGTSHALCVFTDDVDGHYRRATASGAVIVQEVQDEDFGCRGYMARDIEGHLWYFSNYRPGIHWGGDA